RGGKEKWIPGTVTKIPGPLTYIVRLPGNNRRTVHVEHMSPRDDSLAERPVQVPDGSGALPPANAAPVLDKPSVPVQPTRPPAMVQTPVRQSQPRVSTPEVVVQSPAKKNTPTVDLPRLRRSTRVPK
ncbi:hypothetical protein LSAT2_014419, partial [Lamellibrachia satsuma]